MKYRVTLERITHETATVIVDIPQEVLNQIDQAVDNYPEDVTMRLLDLNAMAEALDDTRWGRVNASVTLGPHETSDERNQTDFVVTGGALQVQRKEV